jgi:replicative DNA helicase
MHHGKRLALAVRASVTIVPLRIADRRAMTIDRLSSLIRSETATRKLGLVVIDYLGLITPTDRRKQRWESITEISNQLKSIAQSKCVPILCLSQLNRDSEGEVPKLSHLRDSGAIEQDADIVLLLHREKRSSTVAELFVAKNRNGRTGKIQLDYDAARFQFRTHSQESSEKGRFNDFC